MRIAASVAVVLACLATSAAAQAFVDLDFDDVHVPLPPGSVDEMPWDEAAPGWSHSDGDSTGDVAWLPNAGYSQSYVLLLSPFGSASGPYGFGLKSGTFHEDEPRGPFVYAHVSQTGQLGPQVTTIEMLSSSYLFGVTLDGQGITMQPVGLDPTSPNYAEDVMGYSGEWAGDVSSFAGQVVDLQITDLIATPNPAMLEIDQIEFLPVREPATAALFGLGLLAGVLAGGRRALRPAWPRPGRA